MTVSLNLLNRSALQLPIDYQRVRHTAAARRVRRAIYRLLVGRDGWPLVFRPPVAPLARKTSPHLYVHLPFCRRLCPHCPYNKTLYDDQQHRAYATALANEMKDYFEGGDVPPVRTFYIGGGTPSITPDLIEAAIDLARPWLAREAEVGVEVHPEDATPELLSRLKNIGVNRVSLGIESFRPDLLRRLGRSYTPAQAAAAIRAARETGFSCVDTNLICAIPGQTHLETADDARRCLELGADQISAYTLFTFVHTPVGRGVARGQFPIYGDVSRVRALWAISRACREAGFRRTSPWHYTRQGITPYSTVTRESYVGFGAGAASKVDGIFSFNTFSIDAYIALERNRPAVMLEPSERFRKFHWLYWQLYKTDVDGARYRELFGGELDHDFRPLFSLLRLLGMARPLDRQWRVTEFGAIWMHRLQQLFSISYIDDVWSQCKAEPWPKSVILR